MLKSDSVITPKDKEKYSAIASVVGDLYPLPIKLVGAEILASGTIKGRFFDTSRRVLEFTLEPQTGRFKYKLVNTLRGSPRERTDARSSKDKCKKGVPCGEGCIARNKSCTLKLNARQQQQIKARLGDEFEGNTIRELQQKAREAGVYKANHQTKTELQNTLRTLKLHPNSQEQIRRTLEKRRNQRKAITKTVPKGLSQLWGKAQHISKVAKREPDTAGLLIAAAITGVSGQAMNAAKQRYKNGLDESALVAYQRSQTLPVDRTNKANIIFAIGGFSGIGSNGQRIKELLEEPGDRTKGEAWFGKHNHIVPFNHAESDIPTPSASKRDANGKYNPLYLGAVAKGSFGNYLTNLARGKNEAATELAANLYAYGTKYKGKNLNVISHGTGVIDEATEILSRMRDPKGKNTSGRDIADRLSIVRLGTPFFGFADDKDWKKRNHRTISSRNDPFSILPKRAAQWISSVRGHEVDDYLKDGEVRDRIREAFGYYASSITGSKDRDRRNKVRRQAIGEGLKAFSPAAGAIWNQLGKVQDMAKENPVAASLTAGAILAGTGQATYGNYVKSRSRNLKKTAAEAKDLSREISVNNVPNSNVTFVVGGAGNSGQSIIEGLPDDIKGNYNEEKGNFTGGKTYLVNAEDYGVNSPQVPDNLAPGSARYYAHATQAYGKELARGVTGAARNKPFNPESIRLAAVIYKQGEAQFSRDRSNYSLNILAAGDGGLKAREAMELLAEMQPKGAAIARHVNLATFGTPSFGVVDPGVKESSFMGQGDLFSKLPHRQGGKTSVVPGVSDHSVGSYLKSNLIQEALRRDFYQKTKPKPRSKPKSSSKPKPKPANKN